MLAFFFMILLLLTAVFLILLILVQRGKGGGLAGALGGMGGQSAFGTKAGDTFTKITVGVAAFWIVLCVVSIRSLSATSKSRFDHEAAGPAVEEPADGAGATGGAGSSGGEGGSPSEGSEGGGS
ncbi:MAG: preprotein translocase subunit SecG [Planctomycetes bacterium]|nr:preprotein translocase subunit SecG [Planctomycetota bacterium]